jgi:RNA polymerase sigma-70 factor (ECF subfamily)
VATAEEDLEVVLRALVDRRAFEPLYRKYLTTIYRRCFAKLRNEDDAWDATSITFTNGLAHLDGFRGGSLEAWLRRISDNACTDLFRRTAKQREVVLDPDDAELEAGSDPEAEAIAALDRDQLDRALGALPPRREKIVRLHLLGLTGKEIAARLGVSHDVVRQQQRLALQQLADLLGVEHEGEEARGG